MKPSTLQERLLCALILTALVVQGLLYFAAGWFMRGGAQ